MNSKLQPETIDISPVYICYGASGNDGHEFKIMAPPESPWVGHRVSINYLSDQMTPVSTFPKLGEYQPFFPEGCSWQLDCPEDGEDIAFHFQVQTEYTAKPYSIPMLLGHYARKFMGTRKPIGAPLINEEISTEVQVASSYTNKELPGIVVHWSVDGTPMEDIKTSTSGWSLFKHTFAEEQDHTITATVDNPYNNIPVVHTFPVKVYADSPWKSAKLTVNGSLISWRSPIVLLRGQAHEVIVEVAPTIAAQLRLGIVDDEGLTIDVQPADNDWQSPVEGQFKWSLTPDQGKSGRVMLVFYSREVTNNWEHDCRVISPNLADELDLEIDGEPASVDGTYFLRDKSRTLTLSPKKGSPFVDFPVIAACDALNGIQPENLQSSPDFGTPQTTYSWTITGTKDRGSFQLSFSSPLTLNPMEMDTSKLISQSLEEEAGASLDKDGKSIFWRGEPRTLTLSPKAGSPIENAPVILRWVAGTHLEKTDIICTPEFDVPSTSNVWTITPSSQKSGNFILELILEGSQIPLTLPTCTLLSQDYSDEMVVKLDGVELVGTGTVLNGGQKHDLSLAPKPTSPLAYMPVSLNWGGSTSLTAQNFNCSPSFGSPGMQQRWDVTGDEGKNGKFNLELKWVQLESTMELIDLELRARK